MNELTQLERARAVVDAFVPQDKPGSHYVYAYLGKASYDATQYEFIDGLCLASKRIWHLDECQTDCVGYIGEGVDGRIDGLIRHPFVPINCECRIKLYEGASKADAQTLERLLIAELGCLLDNDRPDGCLANIRYSYGGPFCCKRLEAFAYKAATGAASIVTAVKTFAMTAEKTIIAAGSMCELARQFDVSHSAISECSAGKKSGIWNHQLGHAIYFCKARDYETYQITPMTTQQYQRHRILIAAKLDGSDICSGTAAGIASYAPEIKKQASLHTAARGQQPSAYGWIARYLDEVADEFKVPVATCGPNLSAFF